MPHDRNPHGTLTSLESQGLDTFMKALTLGMMLKKVIIRLDMIGCEETVDSEFLNGNGSL